jgi:glutathione S-transferase
MPPDEKPAMPDITLYFALASRAFTPRWLLEELGIPYRVEVLNLREGTQKRPDYLRVNAMGKVPALTDGDLVVSENPAICIYLADRYGYGTLAPKIEAPSRGAYLRWMVFSTAVFEPAVYLQEPADPVKAVGRGWGDFETVVRVLTQALAKGPWLLGDQFSAADVMLGSLLSIALINRRLPDEPAFKAYDGRLTGRKAYKRAADATWPPDLFPAA